MTAERHEELPVAHREDAHFSILAGGHHFLAVPGEGHAQDGPRMAPERVHELMRLQFHYSGVSGRGSLNLRQQQPMAVRRKLVQVGNLREVRDGDAATRARAGIPQVEVAVLVESEMADLREVSRRTETAFRAHRIQLPD